MQHIEFVGLPGAGKTELYKRLISKDKYFGGLNDGAVNRWMMENAPLKYRVPYRAMPQFVTGKLEKRAIQYRLRSRAFDEFVLDYPRFLDQLSLIIQSADQESGKLYSMTKNAAEKYQIGIQTVQGEELLVLGESFHHRAISILWRFDSPSSFPLSEYFDRTPSPLILVYVDSPIETCIKRLLDRGGSMTKSWTSDNLTEVMQDLDNICNKGAC